MNSTAIILIALIPITFGFSSCKVRDSKTVALAIDSSNQVELPKLTTREMLYARIILAYPEESNIVGADIRITVAIYDGEKLILSKELDSESLGSVGKYGDEFKGSDPFIVSDGFLSNISYMSDPRLYFECNIDGYTLHLRYLGY